MSVSMVVALFALSLVMIVGGIASVVQGFPYVRLESGLAMVVGGATAASAGVILLGLSAVVMRLQRLEAAFRETRGGAALPAVEQPRETAFPGMVPPGLAPAAIVPAAPALAGAAGLAGLTIGAELTARRDEPDAETPTPTPSVDPGDRFVPTNQAEAEPPLPDLLPQGEPVAPASKPAEDEREAASHAEPPADHDLFAATENETCEEKPAEPAALRSSLPEDANEPEASPQEERAPEPKPEDRQVVGTYASGGNTYVMFADGSIEAETPRGRFTFGSLEELKSFVEAGGESDARGAA